MNITFDLIYFGRKKWNTQLRHWKESRESGTQFCSNWKFTITYQCSLWTPDHSAAVHLCRRTIALNYIRTNVSILTSLDRNISRPFCFSESQIKNLIMGSKKMFRSQKYFSYLSADKNLIPVSTWWIETGYKRAVHGIQPLISPPQKHG